MKRCFVVESDCLDICVRLKEIDKDYFLMFNIGKCKFELHNKSQGKDTFCLAFPFEQIDERMLDMARKTRVENCDALFEEMEKENRKCEAEILSATINAFKEKIYES